MSVLIDLAAFGAAALAFAAEPSQMGGHVVVEPRLLLAPDDTAIATLYPWMAFSHGRGGSSSMVCRVRRTRTLAGCRLVGESPEGLGFGRAMLDSAKYWRVWPQTIDGRAASDGKIKLTINWAVER